MSERWISVENEDLSGPLDGIFVVVAEDPGETIAMTVDGNYEQCRSRARLIAAAPDLLEACKAAVAAMYPYSHPEPLLDALRAAIARAEGHADANPGCEPQETPS